MSHIKRINREAKVLPFERDGAFYLRRGTHRLERNNLLEAVANYRRAHRKEPDNLQFTLALAEALTQMQRFEESNSLLLPLLRREDLPGECYFGMACNFIGLQQFDYAQDSLERYLTEEPEGPYAYDAMDMLDAIESDDIFYRLPDIPTEREVAAQEACARGRRLMEQGEARRSVAVMEAAAARYPELSFVRNNLAMAYFCRKQTNRAIVEARAVLEREPENVQARCNLILFLHGEKREKEAAAELVHLRHEDLTRDPDDLNRMAVTFMEFGLFADAQQALKRLLALFPYDEGATHRMAVCNYQLGHFLEAREGYDRLLKINPDDTIARYYRTICQKAVDGEPEDIVFLAYYQVPYTEILRRVRAINAELKAEREVLQARWEGDSQFRSMLLWALRLPEISAKRALLVLIADFRDEHAVRTLKGFLLDPDQPDGLKNEAFLLLRALGEREPYIAIMNGALVESRGAMAGPVQVPEDMPAAYQRVAAIALDSMHGTHSHAAISAAMEILSRYLEANPKPPHLSRAQIYAMAAALEYLAGRKIEGDASLSKGQICTHYGISLVRLNNALGRLGTYAKEPRP